MLRNVLRLRSATTKTTVMMTGATVLLITSTIVQRADEKTRQLNTKLSTNDDDYNNNYKFPTYPGFLVPVGMKKSNGVYALTKIRKGTKMWVWTDRIVSIHRDDLDSYIETKFGAIGTNDDDRRRKTQTFLRRGFVLPRSSERMTLKTNSSTITKGTKENTNINENGNNYNYSDNYFHSFPTYCGRFTKHSFDPNMGPDGNALRDIDPGEELLMDYSFFGNPIWYQYYCAQYDVLTIAQDVEKQANAIKLAKEYENLKKNVTVSTKIENLKKEGKKTIVVRRRTDRC